MRPLQSQLLEAAFPEGVPALVTELLPQGWDPARFDAGPIFGSDGAARFYVADASDRAEFTAAVLRAAPGAEDLLSAAREGTRRMVDVGASSVDVYLDDLHLESGRNVMCDVHHHPSRDRSQIVLLDAPEDLGALRGAWGHGRFARRVGDRRSVLWITEAKHAGRVAEVETLAANLFTLPTRYLALRERVSTLYVEGIELHPDGRIDLTPGVA